MAIKVKLEKDGFIKDGFVGYSYTSAIFDFWVPAFRLDFNAFIFFFGIYILEEFLSEFFKIYSVLNYYSINNEWFFTFLNTGIHVFPLFIALFIAAFYNKYYTNKMLKDGWKPLENDEYSTAILKDYSYLPYSKEELEDDIKMERYREFSNSARKEERSKFYSAAGIWITLFVIIFLLVYFNAINLTRYY